jgi:osmotically-inducible protein OsmY
MLVSDKWPILSSGSGPDRLGIAGLASKNPIFDTLLGQSCLSMAARVTKKKGSKGMAHEVVNSLSNNLRDSVLTEIEWEPEICSRAVTVTAEDGIVTLSGLVGSYLEKVAAERAAKRVYGTRGVANEIRVEPGLSRTDPEILNNAIQVLSNDTRVPDHNIRITVKRGWVTLEGWVERHFQSTIAENAVSQLTGIRGITGLIKVRPALLAIELKSSIELALRRSADVDQRRVAVEVDGCSVKLSGSLRSWAQRQAVESVAWAAPGVSTVDNHIAIVPEAAEFRDRFNPALDGKVQPAPAKTSTRASRVSAL